MSNASTNTKEPNKPIQLIVGLGNPGADYANTRHNVGQDFVEQWVKQHAQSLSPASKFFGLSAQVRVAGSDFKALIPTTYMNRSGQAVAALAQFYKIPPSAILVVHDELDLAPGVARFKYGGGHGGHNGLRDIIKALGNNKDFARLRIGIGHPGQAKQVTHYVLKKASAADQQNIDKAMDSALDSLPEALSGDWEKAMRQLHSVAK